MPGLREEDRELAFNGTVSVFQGDESSGGGVGGCYVALPMCSLELLLTMTRTVKIKVGAGFVVKQAL